MTSEEALSFLREHQPLPDDSRMSQELIEKFDKARRHFIDNPDARCIPLFLGAFGDKDGFGVYQVTDDVFRKYDRETVIPYLETYLNSAHLGVRYNATDLAIDYSHPSLIDPLSRNLNDPDCDVRSAAALALAFIRCDTSADALRARLDIECDESVRESIIQSLIELEALPSPDN